MNRLRTALPRRKLPKLVPPRADRLVRRARISTAIQRALRSGICWIAAPAGYGKTSAVLDYLGRKRGAVIWYRVDEGDQDIASFFHHLAATLPARDAAQLPVFGPEYADQPADFARRFFRAWFARLRGNALLVLDDLHYADVAPFRAVLAMLLRELPDSLRCICLSRTLVPAELRDFHFKGRLGVVEQRVLEFSEREARTLVSSRAPRRKIKVDVAQARGWAAGLVLLADRAFAHESRDEAGPARPTKDSQAIFTALARQMFEELGEADQESLLKLSLLPEITTELATGLSGAEVARGVLGRLHQRQLLITRSESASTWKLHDLLRDFLRERLPEHFSAEELGRLRGLAARLLDASGDRDAAIDLALEGKAWPLARTLMAARADALLAQGRRATLSDWCAKLPDSELDGWLAYWLGVASMADDATAERWFARAWESFSASGDLAGQILTAARAVLAKSDSWRTHHGLAEWTDRMLALIGHDLPPLGRADRLLADTGMLRAVDFGSAYQSDSAAMKGLRKRLLDELSTRSKEDTPNLRLMASQTLIDHSGSAGLGDLFEKAVDAVAQDLRSPEVSPWVLGVWLVTFGSVTSRYFSYSRQGFPYASAEEALRAAVAIGEREGLRGVEFGALYHLQLLMKVRNDWSEFGTLIARIGRIADSRYTTQVAVAADCQAALATRERKLADAWRAVEKFMAAIEEANEPPIERWPHFITRFQVLLVERKPVEAGEFLEGLLHLFDGAVRARTQACVYVARAFAAKWSGSRRYSQDLRTCMQALRAVDWAAVLINLPDLLAELCADALEREIEREFCSTLIQRRRLVPPADRPAHWPWTVRVYVMGEFRLTRDGELVNTGFKAPTRSLDVLRALAIARNHTCSLADLYEWFWPDAEGDAAKAACEQALHRLRKLLQLPEVLVQREGKLRLAPELVWVDLDGWELALSAALRPDRDAAASEAAMQNAFDAFTGPMYERNAAWLLPTAERMRGKFLELTERLARHREAQGNHGAARAIYLRAIDMYPAAARCYEGMIRNRLAMHDEAGALDDYQRYRRMLEATPEAVASPAIRQLVAKLLA
jgi:LuxR family transcriptional regulator, maltose regulon positive regulatory protein